ncbi:MAG: tetratricopeptide repeat protein [Candidatus Hydrogenedens sp.]
MDNENKKNKDWVILSWILLFAFCFRIIYLWQLVDAPDFIALRQDLDVQDYQARAILSGDWTVREGVSDPHIPTTPYYRPPGYPYFLAVVYYFFDGSYLAPRFIHFFLGLVHIVLIYFLARIIFNRIAGLCASFLVATYWAFIYYEGEVNDPALFVFLVPCILFLIYYAVTKDFILYSFFSGLCIGIYAIMRPNILSFIPFLSLWILFFFYKQKKLFKSFFHIFFLIIAIFTVITPVTVRNYLVSGEFVPISTYFGENLLIGNSEDADGVTPWLPYLQELEGTGNWSVWHYDNVVKGLGKFLGREVSHSEASNIFAKMAINYIIHHPWQTFLLTCKKAILFWSPQEITENKVVEGERQHYIPLKYMPRFPIVLSTFLLGLFFLIKNIFFNKTFKDTNINIYFLTLVLLFIFTYFASFLPFFVNARARVPILGLMFIIGGYTFSEIRYLFVKRRITPALISIFVLVILFLITHIDIIPYKPDMCRWHYDRADSYLRVGRVDEALQEVHALMSRPERPMTYMPFRLGHALAKLNYSELAIDLLRLALSPDPSEQPSMYREDIYYHIGALFMKLKRYDEAIKEFENALSLNPKDPRVHNDLGVIYKERNDLVKAEQEYKYAIDTEPEFNLAIANLTELYIQQKKYAEAIELLGNSLKLQPQNTELLYNLGFVYHNSGQLEKALSYYQQVLSHDSKEPNTLNNMAMIYLEKNDLEKAKNTLLWCICKNSYFTLAYANMGDILYSENQLPKALYYYDKGLETNYEHIGLCAALALLYTEMGNAEKGIVELMDVLKKHPESTNLWFALGNIYKNSNQNNEAIGAYNKVLDIDSSYTSAYRNLMEIYLNKGDVNKTLEIFEKAKQNIKDSEQIEYLSSLILEKQGNTNK